MIIDRIIIIIINMKIIKKIIIITMEIINIINLDGMIIKILEEEEEKIKEAIKMVIYLFYINLYLILIII